MHDVSDIRVAHLHHLPCYYCSTPAEISSFYGFNFCATMVAFAFYSTLASLETSRLYCTCHLSFASEKNQLFSSLKRRGQVHVHYLSKIFYKLVNAMFWPS